MSMVSRDEYDNVVGRLDVTQELLADANAQLNEMRRERDSLAEELRALRDQKHEMCVPTNIAEDCAHIAARGQHAVALEVARRYSQPRYTNPVPESQDVVRDAGVDDATCEALIESSDMRWNGDVYVGDGADLMNLVRAAILAAKEKK